MRSCYWQLILQHINTIRVRNKYRFTLFLCRTNWIYINRHVEWYPPDWNWLMFCGDRAAFNHSLPDRKVIKCIGRINSYHYPLDTCIAQKKVLTKLRNRRQNVPAPISLQAFSMIFVFPKHFLYLNGRFNTTPIKHEFTSSFLPILLKKHICYFTHKKRDKI
jgi:hypothetical protein